LKILLLPTLVILLIVLVPSVVHATEISVITDKSEYTVSDTIVISGTIDTIIDNTSVIIQIIHDAAYVHLAQLQVAQDGSFTETVLAEGALWDQMGTYTVRASYGNEIVDITFELR